MRKTRDVSDLGSAGGRLFGRQCWWLAGAFIAFILVFAVFAFPWLRQMDRAVPSYPLKADAMLIIWILSWVSHALLDGDVSIFDANIFYPAPAQLTGSEHFLAFQPVFAPIYWLTGEPALAAGVVVFLTYPLAAVSMATLLVKLGCSRSVAWLCGLSYGVGFLRVPMNLHALQYPNLYLPLVILGFLAARERPGARSGLILLSIVFAAVLTSFYVTVTACVALGLWLLSDAFGDRKGVLRAVAIAGAAILGAAALGALVLAPYVARGRLMSGGTLPWDHAGQLTVWIRAASEFWKIGGNVPLVGFAAFAVLGLGARGDAVWRRLALPGTLLVFLGAALVVGGLPDSLGQIAAHTPLRNYRAWLRLLLVVEFGLCLLVAAGLHVCVNRYSRRFAFVVLTSFFGLAVLPRLLELPSSNTFVPQALGERETAYRRVGEIVAEHGRGPVLELPSGGLLDVESMLGSTVHWLSLVNGFSGYVPPHVPALRAEVRALPDPEALQNLVDLSHVRWILLRPQADWPGRARTSMQDGLADSDLVGRSFSIEGFTLFEVDATARRSEWFAAIAAGPRPGRTALGTPIRELTPAEAVASVVLVDEPRVVRRKGRLELRLRVRNDGTADWPVLGNAPLHPLRSGAMTLAGVEAQMVYLEARWTPLGAAPARREPEVHGLHLIRDLPAGDSLVRKFSVPMPVTPGRYRLDVRVAQKQGRGFRAPPSRPLSQVIDVDRGTATRRSNRS